MSSKRSTPEFEFAKRAAAAEGARLAIKDAFRALRDRNDRGDPATRAWLAAIERFHAAVDAAYPPGFWEAIEALKTGDAAGAEPVIRFLEADPFFFRSGYVRERALKLVGRAALDRGQARRLRAVCLAVVCGRDRREFRNFCRLAARLATPGLMSALETLSADSDEGVRRRAGWMAEAVRRNPGAGRLR